MEEHAKDIHSQPKPRCPDCGRGVEKSEKVCRNCGTNLTQHDADTSTIYDDRDDDQ